MKKKLLFLSFLFSIVYCTIGLSQTITSPSSSYSTPTVYTNGSPNDVIYGFCTPNAAGAAVTGSLTATAGVPNCTFVWTIYDPATNTYNPFTTQAGLTTSTITGLASGGYHVTITNGAGTVVACDLAWVWVNQTTATVGAIAAGCSPFSLNGTASAVSNFTYYNPPPEPFTINAATSVNVCVSATHTFVSDLGFFLVGPASCGSPTVTLSPNPGANGQGSVCNSGDNVNNLCFTTTASPNFDPCAAAAPYTGTYDSYGPAGTPTIINWTGIYGCDASEGGWSVQIYDCIGSDVGALTSASINFSGNSGCGASTVSYNSGAINSAIDDNSCTSGTASIFTVPNSVSVPIVLTGGNTITYQWTSNPPSAIPNSTTSLTPNINPVPTVDTWYYLTVTDNYGCVKKDSAFFDYSPPGLPIVTPAGPFCVNAAASNLTADVAGGTWSGTGITNATNGTFNPATAGTGTFTITYTTPGVCGGSGTIDIIVNPLPTVTVPANTTVCNGANVPAANFTSTPAGGTFDWTNTDATIGLAASGSGNIASFTATNTGSTVLTAVVTVTPTLNGCTGIPSSYTITVNPTPTLNPATSQTVCNSISTAAINFVSVPAGATINWTNSNTAIGIGAGAAGNIASFAGTNATSSQISGNFSATPTLATCIGSPITFTISVDPTPVLTAVPSETLCAGASTTAVNFVTNPTGGTVAWTNSNAAIGAALNGSGNIASYTATNGTAGQIAGNFSATPTLNTCVGTPITFTITVNPIPVLNTVTSQTVCEGTSTAAVNFISNPAGATVGWGNTITTTGLAANGAGNISAFTGLNGTAALMSSVVTAIPTLNTCIGSPITFTISIAPTPTLAAVPSQTVCEGSSTNTITFNPTPAGVTTINWTNSATSIGLPAAGSGDIASYNASNGTGAVVNAAFVATPIIGTCSGTPVNYTITVNPAVTLSAIANQTICEGATTAAVNFVSNPVGATVNWTNTVTGTGLAASGAGDIASFTGLNGGATSLSSVVTATPTLNTCTYPPITFTITVDPTPSLSAVTSQTVCEGSPIAAIIFNPTPAGVTTINWTNSVTSIGLPAAGSGDIASYNTTNGTGAIVNAAFVATPVIGTCSGTSVNYTITVNPAVTLNAVANQTICEGTATAAVNFVSNPLGATVNWTNSVTGTGLAASGASDIVSFTGLNGGATSLSSVVTATPTLNTCTYPPITFTITVDPTPSLSAVPNQTVCEGLPTTAITFIPTPAGVTTINWTNSATSIGLPATGSGDIASYNAANGTGTIVNAAFVATPVIGTCSGTPVNYTITVNPAVTANPVASFTVCNTAIIPASAFASTPAGATFGWTNSDNSIGLASNGTGDYTSFTANNLITNPIISTISITPTLNGCVGPSISYNITVNPTPAPPVVGNVAYCLNDNSVALTAVQSTGGTLNWWGTSAAGGVSTPTGDIPSTGVVSTTNYYVSQTVLGCESPRAQIQVVINVLPSITAPADIIVCSGDVIPLQIFVSNPVGATINWANDNINTGLAGSGVGDVPSFASANSGLSSIVSAITVIPTIGSCVGASITYSITVKPLPSVSVNNITACNTESVPLTTWTSSPAGSAFNWTNTDPSIGVAATGNTDIPAFNAINSGATAANAIITVTPILNTCTGPSSSFTITVNPTPTAPLGTNPTYCLNDPASPLTATGSNLLWYSTLTGGVGSGTPPTPSTAVVGISSSFVSQTILSCESPKTQITTTVNGLPVGTLLPVASKCPPLYTDLILSSGSNLVTYNWDLGDGTVFSGNDTVPNHGYVSTGTYTVSVVIEDNNTCSKTLTFPNAVTVFSVPDAQFIFGPQPTSILDPVITFNSYSTGSAPLINNWDFGDNTGVVLDQDNPVYTYLNAGTYSVQLTTINSYGCIDSITSTLVIDNDFTLYVPDGFSPNEDGLNDEFSAKSIGISEKDFKMFIYDRWGNLIYYSDDITKGWSGKVQGKDNISQEDTFAWKIYCRSESGQKIEKSGHVTIVR